MQALVSGLHPGRGGGRHSRGDCWISSLRLDSIAPTSLAPDLWPAADLRGRNMVMGDWLSTVSYWHLTKCREQNEFTPLFLNHQQARAGLLPWPPFILTAITRSPISWRSERRGRLKNLLSFLLSNELWWALLSPSGCFPRLGWGGERLLVGRGHLDAPV